MHSRGFPPVAGADSRVLVLGTLPGPRSLQMRQYYAQPRNAFWPIMGRLFGAYPELAYPARLAVLKKHRVALWDVCHAAFRPGALDAAIDTASIVPNDLDRFLKSHRRIRLICFNGRTAEKLYRRLVLPGLPESRRGIPGTTLPSTSPAYAAMRFEEKLQHWEVVRRESGGWGDDRC